MNIQEFLDQMISMVGEGTEMIYNHPLAKLAQAGQWSVFERKNYSLFQLGTAMIWPGFLAAASAVAQNPMLREALRGNAACEAGAAPGSVAHSALARKFCISQGISLNEVASWVRNTRHHDDFINMSEILESGDSFIVGRLWASEALAGAMFQAFLPAFESVPGCDVTYMREHIEVDTDEHAAQLFEAMKNILANGGDFAEIERGVHASVCVRENYLAYIGG